MGISTNKPKAVLTDNAQNGDPKETPLECFRCGVCCIKYQVPLNQAEAQRIADYLVLPLETFLDRFADHRWPGTDSLLCHFDGACAFLSYDPTGKVNNCSIHAVKPAACRDWRQGLNPPECRDGLAKHWQLSVNSSGQLEGSEEKIATFQSFLKSLATEK